MSDRLLEGKVAIVTGAGSTIGFGRAMTLALVRAGARVAMMDIDAQSLAQTADEAMSMGGRHSVLTIVGDVSRADDAARAVEATVGQLGGLHILVNNAGTNRPRAFLEVTEDDYDTITTLNLRAAYFAAQAVARRMAAARVKGSIIHVSSQMGHVGGQRRTVYCMTKHGIEGLTKAMAIDLAPLGIRVNSIGPTFIDTPLTRPFWNDKAFHADVLSRIKLGRLGTVEDLMGAVVFLASDAAALITGTALVVDGGWTAE